MSALVPEVSVVIPNWNGYRWLPDCLRSLRGQTLAPLEVIVVDNGSSDGSLAYLRDEHPDVRLLELGRNTGFAVAANRGLEAARAEFVALLNTDVVLDPDWLERVVRAIVDQDDIASVACKMVSLSDPHELYDAGDVLRRDGACVQRGRFTHDDGRFDQPGEVFGACAGAALYRRTAVSAVGGFDERYFAYLEDVDLALRLRLAGWQCRYEPALAQHAGEGSSHQLPDGHRRLVTRNTVYLIVKVFPLRWLPFVAYRQCAWAWHAKLERRLRAHLRALASVAPLLGPALSDRRRLRPQRKRMIELAVPRQPVRGRGAEGHPSRHAVTPHRLGERRD